ncbi:MAG: hypothetical protein ACT4NY_32635 [Pseudonocardiales bacterium]
MKQPATTLPAACPSWCDSAWCCPGVRHHSTPVQVDTTDATYDLSLVRWDVNDDCTPMRQPPQLALYVAHKTEIAETPAACDGNLSLTVCAKLSPAEGQKLINAMNTLLRLATGVAVDGDDE